MLASAQSDSKSIHSFNGMRIARTQEPFQVIFIDANQSFVRIIFNSPVNPNTVRKKDIFINGLSLEEFDQNAKIRFNTSGRLLEIQTSLPADSESVIEFNGARSFDEFPLETKRFPSIKPGFRHEYNKISEAEIILPKEEKSK